MKRLKDKLFYGVLILLLILFGCVLICGFIGEIIYCYHYNIVNYSFFYLGIGIGLIVCARFIYVYFVPFSLDETGSTEDDKNNDVNGKTTH